MRPPVPVPPLVAPEGGGPPGLRRAADPQRRLLGPPHHGAAHAHRRPRPHQAADLPQALHVGVLRAVHCGRNGVADARLGSGRRSGGGSWSRSGRWRWKWKWKWSGRRTLGWGRTRGLLLQRRHRRERTPEALHPPVLPVAGLCLHLRRHRRPRAGFIRPARGGPGARPAPRSGRNAGGELLPRHPRAALELAAHGGWHHLHPARGVLHEGSTGQVQGRVPAEGGDVPEGAKGGGIGQGRGEGIGQGIGQGQDGAGAIERFGAERH